MVIIITTSFRLKYFFKHDVACRKAVCAFAPKTIVSFHSDKTYGFEIANNEFGKIGKKTSETDPIKSEISSETSRGKKDSTERQ